MLSTNDGFRLGVDGLAPQCVVGAAGDEAFGVDAGRLVVGDEGADDGETVRARLGEQDGAHSRAEAGAGGAHVERDRAVIAALSRQQTRDGPGRRGAPRQVAVVRQHDGEAHQLVVLPGQGHQARVDHSAQRAEDGDELVERQRAEGGHVGVQRHDEAVDADDDRIPGAEVERRQAEALRDGRGQARVETVVGGVDGRRRVERRRVALADREAGFLPQAWVVGQVVGLAQVGRSVEVVELHAVAQPETRIDGAEQLRAASGPCSVSGPGHQVVRHRLIIHALEETDVGRAGRGQGDGAAADGRPT